MFRKLISLSLAFVMLSVTAFAATDIVGLNAAYAAEESAGTLTVTNGKLFINGYGVQGTLSLKSAKDATANVVAAIFDDEGELLNAIIGADVELTAGTETPYPVTLDVPKEEAKDNSYAFYLWEKDTLVPLANSVSATATYGWTGKAAATAPATAVMDDGETYYQIKSPEDLAWFGENANMNDNAALCNDIYLNNVDGEGNWYDDSAKLENAKLWWNGTTKNFAFSDDTDTPYTGTFDGNNKTIYGLYVKGANTSKPYSLVGAVSGATIKNLIIADAYLVNNYTTDSSRTFGVLVGDAINKTGCTTSICNINVLRGKVTNGSAEVSPSYFGSIVGFGRGIGSENGTLNIVNCTSSINIDFFTSKAFTKTGNNVGIGGIAGKLTPNKDGGDIINIDGCSFNGNIKLNSDSTRKAGGILGKDADASARKTRLTISNCSGKFTAGDDYANALVGIESNWTDGGNNTITFTVSAE